MIYSYNIGSESAKQLAEALETKLISHNNSKYSGSKEKVVINWGASSVPEEVSKSTIINNPVAVSVASNKLSFFKAVKDVVNLPDYTEDVNVAYSWLDQGDDIVLRSVVNGHSGAGISVLTSEENGGYEKFFKYYHKCGIKFVTKYIPKKEEYRVHVVGGKVIDVRRKIAKPGYEPQSWKIRSAGNGFIFQKNNIKPHPSILEQSIVCVKAVGLDFGAVDVIWNDFRQKAYVLEVNTAPGMEGSTVTEYKKAFLEMFEANQVKKVKEKFSFLDVSEAQQILANFVNTSAQWEPSESPPTTDSTPDPW